MPSRLCDASTRARFRSRGRKVAGFSTWLSRPVAVTASSAIGWIRSPVRGWDWNCRPTCCARSSPAGPVRKRQDERSVCGVRGRGQPPPRGLGVGDGLGGVDRHEEDPVSARIETGVVEGAGHEALRHVAEVRAGIVAKDHQRRQSRQMVGQGTVAALGIDERGGRVEPDPITGAKAGRRRQRRPCPEREDKSQPAHFASSGQGARGMPCAGRQPAPGSAGNPSLRDDPHCILDRDPGRAAVAVHPGQRGQSRLLPGAVARQVGGRIGLQYRRASGAKLASVARRGVPNHPATAVATRISATRPAANQIRGRGSISLVSWRTVGSGMGGLVPLAGEGRADRQNPEPAAGQRRRQHWPARSRQRRQHAPGKVQDLGAEHRQAPATAAGRGAA